MAFSPDAGAKYILIGCGDGTFRLWDRATCRPLGPVVCHHAGGLEGRFSPDGRSFVTSAWDGSARLWPMPVFPLEESCDRLRLRLEVRTGLTLRGGETVQHLRAEEWQSRWKRLVELEGSADSAAAGYLDDRAWHERQARDAEEECHPFAAKWHLDRLIALAGASSKWHLYARRARAAAMAGRFAQAASDSDLAMKFAPREAVLDWYRQCAADFESSGASDARIWYLERGLEASPEDRDFLLQLAEARARRGDWKQAAELYERLTRKGQTTLPIFYQHALVCLRAGDSAGYRKVCAVLLKALPDPGPRLNPQTANSVAMLCALGPDAVSDYTRPLALIEHALTWLNNVKVPPGAEAELNKIRHAWLNTQGALFFRAGRYALAVRRLDKAIAAHGGGVPEDWLFLALAHHRLGHAAEAKKYLDRARAVNPSTEARHFWQNLEQDLLRREAEQILEEPKK
jgi:tetratricopeptide (TPR) repeat protein